MPQLKGMSVTIMMWEIEDPNGIWMGCDFWNAKSSAKCAMNGSVKI